MATLGSVYDNIKALLSRSDLDSLIPVAVQHAIDHYERKPFHFNESRISLSVSSGQSEYTLSASLVQILNCTVTVNGATYEITPLTEQERSNINSNNTTGLPLHYSTFGNMFIPYPLPNSDYVATINATKRLATISATTSTNAWTQYAGELVENRALWWLHTFKTRNAQQGMAHKSAEMEALRALNEESTSRVSTGRLRSTSF